MTIDARLSEVPATPEALRYAAFTEQAAGGNPAGGVLDHAAGREGIARGEQHRAVRVHQLQGGPGPLGQQRGEYGVVVVQLGELVPVAQGEDEVFVAGVGDVRRVAGVEVVPVPAQGAQRPIKLIVLGRSGTGGNAGQRRRCACFGDLGGDRDGAGEGVEAQLAGAEAFGESAAAAAAAAAAMVACLQKATSALGLKYRIWYCPRVADGSTEAVSEKPTCDRRPYRHGRYSAIWRALCSPSMIAECRHGTLHRVSLEVGAEDFS